MTRIAFGSCSDPTEDQSYWKTILQTKPQLMVLLGDTVYAKNIHDLPRAYRQMSHHPHFQKAAAGIPMIATLDDNDYGQINAGVDNPFKDLAKKYSLDFFQATEEDDERWHRDGMYTSYCWGLPSNVVQLIVLDVRYNRSSFLDSTQPNVPGMEHYIPDDINLHKTILGQDQWSWLEQQMKVPATVRLIASSLQILANGHGFECWRMLPHERQKLLSLAEKSTGTTLLLSGDRHVGGFYHHSMSSNKDLLWECTSSSLTHSIEPDHPYAQAGDEVDDARDGPFARFNNFGLVDFDWNSHQMTVSICPTNMDPSILDDKKWSRVISLPKE